MITKDEYKGMCETSHIALRCILHHEQPCEQLNTPLHDHYSKTYGIKRSALLMPPTFQSLMVDYHMTLCTMY